MREMSASEPLVTHRNAFKTASELELHHCSRKSVAETYLLATRCPVYRRHDSHLGSCMELENLSGDAKGKGTSSETVRPKVPMRRVGADCSVIARKRGNARGAKGAGHWRWDGANWQQEELQFSAGVGSLRSVARARLREMVESGSVSGSG